MITNDFKGDIEFLFEKLRNRDHFAFSKYADGEYKILIKCSEMNQIVFASGQFLID